MKNVQKAFLAAVFMLFFLVSVGSVLADPQNYGTRAVRITSKCSSGLPDVPPPTASDPACPKVPTIAQSPSGRWSVDISWFDPDTQKSYLADRNNFGVDIIDTTTDQVVGNTGGFVGTNCTPTGAAGTPDCTVAPAPPANSAGPNGVLTTTNPRQLWAGDGNGLVRVFSLDGNGMPTAQLTPVNAGGVRRADELAYDPDDNVVLAAWDDDADLFVALISVSSTPAVLKKISIPEAAGCGIEQPVYDHNTRMFYLAIPCTSAINNANHNTAVHANGEIAVIDPKTKSIVNVFGLDGTLCFPHGLALGPRNNLLLGCSGDAPTGSQMRSIIMRATDGSILQTFTQLGGSDEVWFNPGDNHYYLAMSSWTSTGLTGGPATPSLGIINAGDVDGGASFVQNILTTRTSHSVAANFAVDCAGNSGNGNGNGNNGNEKGKAKGRANGNGFGNGKGNGNNCEVVGNKVYVPLTVVTETGEPTEVLETGGIGVYGQIPAPQNGNGGGGNNGD